VLEDTRRDAQHLEIFNWLGAFVQYVTWCVGGTPHHHQQKDDVTCAFHHTSVTSLRLPPNAMHLRLMFLARKTMFLGMAL
jgi:hypothetical protein